MNYNDIINNNLWFPFTYTQDVKDYPPLIITKGKGIYLYDEQGKPYIDAISSWWVNILGHCNPAISEAVGKQALELEHVLMAGAVSEPTLKLTGLLSSILPPQLQRIFYSDDGSTAVEVALKIALQYWHAKHVTKTDFVTLHGGYHGDTLAAMSVGAIEQYHDLFHTLFKKQHIAWGPYCFRCPAGKNKETCAAECMDSLRSILEQHGNTIAACIFEPMVQGAAGMRVYPAKVLKKLFALCSEFNVLTIADEVAMGFGRTGTMFACSHANVVPDIMCLAKGLTGGYLPMSVTVVKDSIYREFCGDFASGKILYHGHSFTGNPLAAAAATATMQILIRENIPESLKSKMSYFRKKLHDTFYPMQWIGDVRSIGMVGALELVKERHTKEAFPLEKRIPFRICRRALEYGLLIRPLGNVVYFIPPYIITGDEIDTMFSITKRSIEEIAAAY
jgi:adenosylmethionine-8-amino-7-oxononanoate aminotransferase